jgi:hypothetical protein
MGLAEKGKNPLVNGICNDFMPNASIKLVQLRVSFFLPWAKKRSEFLGLRLKP